MPDGQRKAYNVKWDKDEIQGEALLFVRGPVKGWTQVKSGKNDGAMVVTFPPHFTGERDALVIGTEGGLVDVDIEVR
jgi:hypothetical protein